MLRKINFQELFTISPNPYMVLDRDLKFIAANDAYLQTTGARREEIIGRNIFDAFPSDPTNPDDAGVRQLRASLDRVLTTRQPDLLALIPYTIARTTAEGVVYEERFWSATHTPILDEHGEVIMILQHTMDVTELQQLKQSANSPDGLDESDKSAPAVEQAVFRRAQVVQETNQLLDSERRHLRRLFEQAPGFIAFLRGRQHVFELANQAYYQLVGHRELIGKAVIEALPEVREQGFVEILNGVYDTAVPYIGQGVPIFLQRHAGSALEEVYLDFIYQPIIEPDGSVSGIFVQGSNVTAQMRAQTELRRYQTQLEELVRERTNALEQSQVALQQAQKMEAVGNLTGGVAHDFNNLLQIIGGNLQLLQRYTSDNERAQRQILTAISAVERGARLSSQLLAFARRQPLQPSVVHTGELVLGMDELMHRALGEAVEVRTRVESDLWNIYADPHQLENVLLNLAINARDAMDGEGTLKIAIENSVVTQPQGALTPHVPPGEYVLITLSDTGAGMPADVLERAFEPFFTTKSEGHGTGLGLSMAYGFIKQSDGFIEMDSEVGTGTTIRIFLPRSYRTTVPQAISAEVPGEPMEPVEGGSETILVVEDNAEVRETVVEMLTDLGYQVLTAPDGQRALEVIESGAAVDLLFTDVVMPGSIRSTELARRAAELVPGIAVLFTSGYPEDGFLQRGRLAPDVSLLGKPYRQEELARKLRRLLRERQQSVAARTDAATAIARKEDSLSAPLRVLLVEDDESIRYVATEFMTELGHQVIAAASGEEALEAASRSPFDLLFTDISLPGMSGVALACTIREGDPDVPIIFASGYGAAEEIRQTRVLEGSHILPKPFDLDDIERLLETVSRLH